MTCDQIKGRMIELLASLDETGARIATLEAALRKVGACRWCGGDGKDPVDYWKARCDDCNGSGLVPEVAELLRDA